MLVRQEVGCLPYGCRKGRYFLRAFHGALWHRVNTVHLEPCPVYTPVHRDFHVVHDCESYRSATGLCCQTLSFVMLLSSVPRPRTKVDITELRKITLSLDMDANKLPTDDNEKNEELEKAAAACDTEFTRIVSRCGHLRGSDRLKHGHFMIYTPLRDVCLEMWNVDVHHIVSLISVTHPDAGGYDYSFFFSFLFPPYPNLLSCRW